MGRELAMAKQGGKKEHREVQEGQPPDRHGGLQVEEQHQSHEQDRINPTGQPGGDQRVPSEGQHERRKIECKWHHPHEWNRGDLGGEMGGDAEQEA